MNEFLKKLADLMDEYEIDSFGCCNGDDTLIYDHDGCVVVNIGPSTSADELRAKVAE